MTEFAELLAELDTLAKAQSAAADADADDDAKIKAAAEEAGVDTDKVAAEAADDEGTDEEDKGDSGMAQDEPEKPLGKSFGVTLADGTKAEAYDGTEILKALAADLETVKGGTGELAKALTSTVGLIKGLQGTVTAQNALIKALRTDVAKLGATGTGRRALLNINDKPSTTAAPPAPKGVSYPAVMAKALSLQREGKLSGGEVCQIEAHANRGLGIPPELAHLFIA